MYRRLILACGITIGSHFLLAQQEKETIESKSYRLYKEQKYDAMFSFHDSLHKAGVDYYYLRVRSAWARDYLKQPLLAFQELRAARKYSHYTSEEEILLQKSLFNSGMQEAGEKYTRLLNQKASINARLKPAITMIQVDGGNLWTQDKSKGNAENLLTNPTTILGAQDRLRNIQTGSIALRHTVLPGLSLYHQAGYMSLQRLRETGWRNGYRTYPYSGTQGQYYLSAKYQIQNGWSFSPAVHYVYYHQVSEWTESALPAGSVISSLDTLTLHNYLVSGEISYLWRRFKPAICFTGGELNFQKPIQVRPGITWYPKGNLDMYLEAGLTFHQQESISTWIPSLNAGWLLNSNWMTEAGFTLGNLYNYSEFNGRLLFNIADPIRWKSFVSLTYRRNYWNLGITLPIQQRERYHTLVEPTYPNTVRVENKSVYYLAGGALLQIQFYFPYKP
jgi:hypothetical protein